MPNSLYLSRTDSLFGAIRLPQFRTHSREQALLHARDQSLRGGGVRFEQPHRFCQRGQSHFQINNSLFVFHGANAIGKAGPFRTTFTRTGGQAA